MKISAIIPAYNNRDHLRNFLKSLKDQTLKPDEVIVIDDGSTDGTKEMITEEFPSVGLIVHPRNKGACAALNTGIKNAKNGYVVMLDQDLVLPETWMEEIAREIEGDEKIAVVSGLHISPVCEKIENRKEKPSYYGCGFHGGGSIAKKSALIEAGLFPEEFFIYFHEADLAARLLSRGYKIKICPSVVSLNFPCAPQLHGSKAYFATRNTLWYVWKNYPLKYALFPVIFHLSHYFVEFTRRGYMVEFFNGILDALRGLGYALRNRKVCDELGDFCRRRIKSFFDGIV